MSSNNIYLDFVYYDCLISPVNNYKCKKISIQNIKKFGFLSLEDLHRRYPNFPVSCQQYIEKQSAISKKQRACQDGKSSNVENYLKSPKICQNCQSVIPYKKKINRFCSSSCSASYSNTNSLIRKTQIIERKQEKCKILKNSKIKKYLCKSCGASYDSITNRQNCSCGLSNKVQLFTNLRKYFDLDLSRLGSIAFLEDFEKTKDKIFELYQQHSLPSLAEHVGHPDKTGGALGKIFKSLDISLRDRSTAQYYGSIQGRKHPNSCKNVFHTGNILCNNKKYYYRSSYELRYIHLLSNLNIEFEMEPSMIYWCSETNKNRVCFPDFVFENTIVEIKSSFTFNGFETNMKDKFKSYIKNGFNPYLQLDFKYFQLIDENFVELPAGFEPATNHYK